MRALEDMQVDNDRDTESGTTPAGVRLTHSNAGELWVDHQTCF